MLLGTLLLGLTLWLAFVPAKVYLEHNPRGPRASCGSLISPRAPWATGDEVCVDALDARRRAAPVTAVAGSLLVLVAAVAPRIRRAWVRRAPSAEPSPEKETDRRRALQAESFNSLRKHAGGGS